MVEGEEKKREQEEKDRDEEEAPMLVAFFSEMGRRLEGDKSFLSRVMRKGFKL